VPLLPSIPKIVRERLAARQTDAGESKLPDWFNASFVQRFDLERRWTEDAQGQSAPAVHPLRPMAYESLHLTNWQRLFRGVTVPDGPNTVEVRHPYLDIRLLRFMLQVPAMPWCRTKHLFRQAFKGALPKALLARPKTLLPAWPDYILAGRRGLPPVIGSPRLEQFGNPARMPATVPLRLADFHLVSRFAALSHWLFGLDSRSMQPVVFKEGDDHYELAIR
jgi:asparagine synthase (glutamine-hydrolysing)